MFSFVSLFVAALALEARGFAVVGYVPEYRFHTVDWDGIVSQTTHVVLFSLEPTADGDLTALERLQYALEPAGALRGALQRAGDSAPHLLVSVGGAGRSQNFAEVASMAKRRKRFARRLAKLLAEHPQLAGVDLDWETPTDAQQWRDFGKLAREIRDTFNEATVGGPAPLLTMTYHPVTGAVGSFSGLQSKGSGRGFTDFFDLCHAMAYSQYDSERRHSSLQLAEMAIDEWMQLGLPPSRLTLGLPFFGVSKTTGHAEGYGEILDGDHSLLERPDVDESKGVWFNNAGTLRTKVRMAAERGLAGVMIWELGQDKPSGGGSSLLSKVWQAAIRVPGSTHGWSGIKFALLYALPSNEQQVFVLLTVIIGSYMLVLTLTRSPPGYAMAARRPPPRAQMPQEVTGPTEKEPAEEKPAVEEEASTEMPAAEKPSGKEARKR